MKKIFFTAVTLLLLISCSNDDSPTGENLNTNGTVLKKIVIIENGAVTFYTDFIYSGVKLKRTINPDGRSYDYTYTGDLITKIEYFENNVSKGVQLFEYNINEQMVQSKRLNTDSESGYKTIYTYNDDGTIDVATYAGSTTNQNTLVTTKKAYVQDGQVNKIENYQAGTMVNTVEYSYDNKNYPYNGILGYNKLLSYEIGASGNHNNVIQYVFTDANGNVDTSSFTHTYNSYGFTTITVPPATLNQAVTHYYYQ